MPRVTVRGVPAWVPAARLLGEGDWDLVDGAWGTELGRVEAADLQARLRGVGIGGRAIVVDVRPSLKRALVRAARTEDARRRRRTTPGFERPGVRLDPEGRMSLTPERLALEIGRSAQGRPVIDATCGSGGNAIGFARAGCSVVAIDLDGTRLADAAHNARVYGVADRIRFVEGDAVAEAPRLEGALVFVDPPWGADWDRRRTGLADLPLLRTLLDAEPREVWAKVPPSFDPAEVPGAVPEAWFGRAEGDSRRVKFLMLRRD